MTEQLLTELKAHVYKQYSLLGIEVHCIAKNFQLPYKRLDGVVFNIRGDYALCLSTGNHLDFYDIHEWVLQLRQLSSITDDEAIEVALLYGYRRIYDNGITISDELLVNYGREIIESLSQYDIFEYKIYQYLQQQGFALPIYFKGVQYSVERLVELGIYGQFKQPQP